MNATNQYILACRTLLAFKPDDHTSRDDLMRHILKLRQLLQCRVCRGICKDPLASESCQHLICYGCLKVKISANIGCRFCKNTRDVKRDHQSKLLIACYCKLCEIVMNSPIASAYEPENGERNRIWVVIQEASAYTATGPKSKQYSYLLDGEIKRAKEADGCAINPDRLDRISVLPLEDCKVPDEPFPAKRPRRRRGAGRFRGGYLSRLTSTQLLANHGENNKSEANVCQTKRIVVVSDRAQVPATVSDNHKAVPKSEPHVTSVNESRDHGRVDGIIREESTVFKAQSAATGQENGIKSHETTSDRSEDETDIKGKIIAPDNPASNSQTTSVRITRERSRRTRSKVTCSPKQKIRIYSSKGSFPPIEWKGQRVKARNRATDIYLKETRDGLKSNNIAVVDSDLVVDNCVSDILWSQSCQPCNGKHESEEEIEIMD